jgi:putative FmdB family regulatory protein
MPIYEYGCENCGTFEVSQRITDKPLRRCPTCKGKVGKLISSTSFQLKGSGWYVTDYAGKKDDKGTKGKEGGEGTQKAGEGAKADSTVAKESAGTKSSPGKTEATAA